MKKNWVLAYTSQTYAEAITMSPAVSYTPYATSSKEQTDNIITFSQFEERNLLSETCDDVESGDKSNEDSTMLSLIIKEEIDAMDSGDESEDEPISTDILEDICVGSKSHVNINRREAR